MKSQSEISPTNDLAYHEIDFYSQSSSGALIACAVEFKGVDTELNYFFGSYGLMKPDGRTPVALFKLGSAKIEANLKSKEYRRIKHIWISSSIGSSMDEPWGGERNDSENTYVLVGQPSSTLGAKLFTHIVLGGEMTIGYLHEGENIDRVYRLPALPEEQRSKATACGAELLR